MMHVRNGAPAQLHVPDPLIAEAFGHAMHDHVLRFPNPEIAPWYWGIQANHGDLSRATIWPGLDDHETGHALMWGGHLVEHLGYWDYVKALQHINGQIPYRVELDDSRVPKDGMSDIFIGWRGRAKFMSVFPGPSLFVLGPSTWIKEGYDLFRFTQDLDWLRANYDSIDMAATWIARLGDEDGLIGCGSYYQDLPPRLEFDGITTGYGWQNYTQTAELAERIGRDDRAAHWRKMAEFIRAGFQKRFWLGEQCAECIHPFNGPVTHGMGDVDWMAQAMNLVEPQHDAILWEKLARSERLYYGIMPTGVCEKPETYLPWQSMSKYHLRRAGGGDTGLFKDVAAMGRVWFIEAMTRHKRGDGDGLADTIRRVATLGKAYNWVWWERYARMNMPPGLVWDDQEKFRADLARNNVKTPPMRFPEHGCIGHGSIYYGEWPANLVRICCQWLAGVDVAVDGALTLTPAAPRDYFEQGFGLDAALLGRRVEVRYRGDGAQLKVEAGPAWNVRVRTAPWSATGAEPVVEVDGRRVPAVRDNAGLSFMLPATTESIHCTLTI